MKRSRIAGFLILMTLVTSCDRPAKPLVVPKAGMVRSVKASHIQEPATIWEREITDTRRIDALLEHFRRHNTGYRQDTRLHDVLLGSRQHQYKLNFNAEEGSPLPLLIWLGPYWLCGADFVPGEPFLSRCRGMSESERKDILALVGGP